MFSFVAAPDVGFRDAGEIGAASFVLGVAHPTGFPLDLLLLKLGAWLPFGSIAWRQNLVVAVVSAGVLGLLAHLTLRYAIRARFAPGPAAAGAVVASSALGGWLTFLSSASTVEVYSTALCLVLVSATVVLADSQSRVRTSIAGLTCGLALGSHVTAVLYCGVLLLGAFAMSDRGDRLRSLSIALAFFVVGGLVVAYLPLASAGDPPVDWGDPETLLRLIDHLTAARIRTAYSQSMFGGDGQRFSALASQLAELWPIVPFALGGAVILARRATGPCVVLVSLVGLDLAYGAFGNPMGIVDRQVGHTMGAAVAVLGGVGCVALLSVLASRVLARSLAEGWVAMLAAVLAVGTPFDRIDTAYGASELYGSGGNLARLPPRSIALCATDDACAAGFFALHVERIRPDVVLVPSQHLWDQTLLTAELSRDLGIAPPPVEPPPRQRRVLALSAASAPLRSRGQRPVFWEDPGSVDPQLRPQLRVTLWPPWLGAQPGPGPTVAIGIVDAMMQARFGSRAVLLRFERTAWSQTYDRIGERAIASSDVTQAGVAYERATEVAPERAVAWTNLGVVRAQAGDLQGAVAATRRSVELDPRRPTSWANLVQYLAAQGERDAALGLLDRAEALGIHDPRFAELRASLVR